MNATDVADVAFPSVAVYLSMVFVGTLGLVGLLGNILTCVIVWHKLREKSMYQYIFMMSVCDLLYVLASITYIMPLLATGGTLDVAVLAGCNIIQLAMFVPAHTSAWMVVCISIERALFSARIQNGDHLSHRATRLVIAGVVISVLGLNFPFLGGFRSVDPNRVWFVDGCKGVNTVMRYIAAHVYPWLEVGTYLVFPAAIIGVCNVVIVICVRKHRRQIGTINTTGTSTTYSGTTPQAAPLQLELQSMGSNNPTTSSPNPKESTNTIQTSEQCKNQSGSSRSPVVGVTFPAPRRPPQTHVSLSKERSAQRLTKTCVLVSLTYVLLTVPSYGVFIVYDAAEGSDKKWVELMVKVISFLFSLSNHCINCLLYCLTGSIFRKEVCKRLKKLSCFVRNSRRV